MPFDAEGYRKAARAQGIPDSEIEKDIAEEMKSAPPKADFDFPKKGDAEAKGADSWMAPAAIVGLGSAALAAPGIYKSLREKFKPTPTTVQIDPQLDSIPKEWQGIVERSKQNAAAKAADTAAKANPIPRNYTPSVPVTQPNVGVNPAGAFTQPSGYGQTTLNAPSDLGKPNISAGPIVPTAEVGPPSTPPSVQASVQTGDTSKAVQAVVAQELDKATGVAPTEPATPKSPKKEPAVATFKTLADVPEGFVFRSDVGNVDRSLGNILGLEHRANAREMFTGGKPFGQFTGSGPTAYNDEISRLTTDYFKKLQSEIPETILSRDARRAQGIPSDFGTYAKTTNFGKAAKVGGVAGTLIAVADIANAGQQGKYGEAAVRSADLATDYIPMVAQLKQGLAPTEAGAPGVSKQTIQSSALLGSPYAQTEWAKKQRLKEKAGAGRGIAPPSAYMR